MTLLCVGLMTGCRPLYLPVVPDEIPFTPQVRATSNSAINFAADGYPTIELELRDVPEAGWLAVQWFTPSGGEAASQSVWVEPAAEQSVRFTLPADAELVAGEWRAVVSLNGRLVRQLNFTVELPN